jgi:hypothetical protein
MLKQALAVLMVAATPALAAEKAAGSHEVRFDQISFVCGEMTSGGKVVRFIHSTPDAKYIPEFQPPAGSPLAKSWDITYRIICEGGYHRPNVIASAGRKHQVR